ncbi:dioxygenase family protein [Roseomonas mucosa]
MWPDACDRVGVPRDPHRAVLVEGSVRSAGGAALAGAVVSIWHSGTEGCYDAQMPEFDALAIRGRFRTTTEGRFRFWTIMPHFYLIPHNGPVRQMLEAMVWHPFRPAHVHLMVSCLAYEKLVMHVFEEDDPYLDSDAVFGVKAR